MTTPSGQAPNPRVSLDDSGLMSQPPDAAIVEVTGVPVTDEQIVTDAAAIGRTIVGAVDPSAGVAPAEQRSQIESQWADLIAVAGPAARPGTGDGSGDTSAGASVPRQSRSGSAKGKAGQGAPQPSSQESDALDEWVQYFAESYEPTADGQDGLRIGSENSATLAKDRELRRELRRSVDKTLDGIDSLPETTNPDELARRDRTKRGCAAMLDVIDAHTPQEELDKEIRTQLRAEARQALVRYNDFEGKVKLARRDSDRRRGRATESQALESQRGEVAKITAAVRYFKGSDRVAFEKTLLREARRLAEQGGAHRDILSSYATMIKGVKLEEGVKDSLQAAAAADPAFVIRAARPATIKEDVKGRRDLVVTVPLRDGATVDVGVDVKSRRPFQDGVDTQEFVPIPGCNDMFVAKQHPETGEWLLVVNAEDARIGGDLRRTNDSEVPDMFELTDPARFAREFAAAMPHFLRFVAAQQQPPSGAGQP